MIARPQCATAVHIPVLAAIHAAAFPPREAWGEDAIGLQLGMPGVVGLLHPLGGMVIVRVTLDEAEVLTLAVAPAARRRGVATILLAAAMDAARQAKATAMLLEVSVENAAARALYARAGFAEVGRRLLYYADGSDALILRLAL